MASKSGSNSKSSSASSTSKSSTAGNYSGLGGMDSPSERNGRGTAASSTSSSAGSKSTSTSASKGTSPSKGASASVSLGGAKSSVSTGKSSTSSGAGLGAGASASIGASRMGTGRPSNSIGAKATAGASAGVGAIGGPSEKTSRVGSSPSMQTGFDSGRFSGGPLGQQTSSASYSSLGGMDSPSERTGRVGVSAAPSLGTGLAQAYGDLAESATSVGVASIGGASLARAPTHRQAEIQSMDKLATYEKQVAKVVDAGPGWTTVQLNDGTVERRYGPASRAARNNNPGNIVGGKFTRSVGAVGTDGKFAVFPDRQTGINAISSLLGTKSYRDKTVMGAISTYAPPNENDTARYASTVAKAAGVSLDTKLSDMTADQRSRMVNAMMGVEGATGYKSTVQTEGKSYGQPATPSQKASMPASSDPSTLGSLRSPDYSKQPTATEGQQQIDRAATPAKQSFRDKYLGTPENGPVPGTKPQTDLTTGQKIAAGAIDVAASMIPGVGTYMGLANAGLSLTGNKTIGQQIVGSFANGIGGGAAVGTPDNGGGRNTLEAKTDEKETEKAATEAKAAAEATTVKPAERFVSTYLRPTPREKWARG